jgi:serine/threonine protein kinase
MFESQMNPAPTEKVEEIFFSALEINSPAERKDFLARECRGDAGLRSQVEKLLAAQANATRFFEDDGVTRLPMEELARSLDETPGLAQSLGAMGSQDEMVGKSVGPYKLMQRIGEGGCGTVYVAEQEKPVRRRVAFKIIKLGMDTKSVIARFEAERQALALMDHPNIARVLEAGATKTGRPYFVMELVRGIKITEYCDQNELDTTQRLQLFIQVCNAIQHAHQKGVIHRDVKPSNILVTIIDGAPVPKVIDFGIAKAIEGRLTDNTIYTAYEHFIGTPAYMSPEQAVLSGVDVDTRSDIYSLGVLLYELLTGRTPFATKELLEHGIDGLRRTLQEREPQRPSVMVTTMQGSALTQMAHSRHAEPLKLASILRGDLDWIVICALEKDRARRYQTANGLAMDVQRYLDNEPIVARPPSRLYRLQKLVLRNKAAFAFGIIMALVLFSWVGTSTWLLQKEREARKRAVAAEQQQSRLRQEAEDRERIAMAAVALGQGKIEEADGFVSKVSVVTPSLEAESVLRTLGKWHALKGQWAQAAKRFKLLLEADQLDNSLEITTDLLIAGPILIERGDRQGYERFRQAAIARFSGTMDPLHAERTVKICLLLPADEATIRSLKPLAQVAEASFEKDQKLAGVNSIMAGWRCISLGLMAYREGQAPAAKEWARRCLAYRSEIPPRSATARIIRALACHQQGARAEARSELEQGRRLIETEFSKDLREGSGNMGYWFDWLFARILLREAEALIEPASSAGK